MEAVPRTQTAFRLKNSLLERLKFFEKSVELAQISFAYNQCCDFIITNDK